MTLENQNITIYNELPTGWKKLNNAATAPNGYEWAFNGKSRFSGKYKHALVMQNKKKGGK